jgi:two-component system chemotaxis sensor kinase CheA
MCEEGRDFDVIISDIEMPGMDGFEFAQALKQKDSRWNNTPLVALSSHSSQEDLDRGRAVGFTDYVPKFDRDALLHSLAETLAASGGAA